METTALHQIQHFPTSSHRNMVTSNVSTTSQDQDISGRYSCNFFSTSNEASALDREENHECKTEPTEPCKNMDNDSNSNDPNIDIFINNVVCTFSVRCHLNLKRIGMESINVEYKREAGKVLMKLRNPNCTATIWASGKITITGNSSEKDAKISARRIARKLQAIGFRVHYHQFKVVNVLGTCRLPFAIRITQFSEAHPQLASYEPEIHPAATYRIKSPKATLKLFTTGSITVTAPSVENIQHAIHHIYPLVEPFQMKRIEKEEPKKKKKQDILTFVKNDDKEEEEEEEEEEEDEEWESELSDDDL